MTKEEIREITDKAKSPCLVGIRGFDADVQQYTCRFLNGEKCQCYKDYKNALAVETRKRCPANLICNCPSTPNWDGVCKMINHE